MSKISTLLVVCMACRGRDAGTPPPTGAAVPAPASPAGSGATPSATSSAAGRPALASAGDRAFVGVDRGLVEVSTGGASQIVADVAVQWCDTDARGQVVWFIGPDGLAVFDLVDRRVHPVIRGALGELAVIVDWGTQQVGGESLLGFDVAAEIHMTATPTITIAMGCDGDRGVYCFEDDGKTPTKAVRALQASVGKLRLADPGYVAMLAKRGEHRSRWSSPPIPPVAPKPPAVDRTRCSELPEGCGALTAIPGSALWLVEIANSRGDYFHETRQLWDPATREYLSVTETQVTRSGQPSPESIDPGDYGGLRISPVGGTLSYQGAVFDAQRVRYAPSDPGHTCGWASGGWRVRGPTDGH